MAHSPSSRHPEPTSPFRLSARPAERIDRAALLEFTFDGRTYPAFGGDTIASALTAAGVSLFSRSFKYHRPRGLLCCAGHCPNCLVQVGDEPNVRACMRTVEPGMAVRAQNVWPSLEGDLLSLVQLFSRLLPVGFYYKTFIRPRRLWPLYETLLRRMAGLGRVPPADHAAPTDKQYLHADVTVIGAGPAGLAAALAAAAQGAWVLLLDENLAPGGHLCFSAAEESRSYLTGLLAEVATQPRITLLLETAAFGRYEDNWIAAVSRSRLYKIRTRSLVVASGAYERPLLFANNDLPGVIMASAVRRLLHLHATVPGRRALVMTANDDGWAAAAELHAAGVALAAVADRRSRAAVTNPYLEPLAAVGIPLHFAQTLSAAHGRRRVTGATLQPLASAAPAQTVACDLIVTSAGWTPANELFALAGGKLVYRPDRDAFGPALPLPGVYLAGRAAGALTPADQIANGRLAGARAAASAGCGTPPPVAEDVGSRNPAAALQDGDLLGSHEGHGKRFVCYCEDVTDVDLETAVAEGYDSSELLKRYSTLSMGPCQGKMCSMHAVRLCAAAAGRPMAETGTTTARPPLLPVTLGALAGQALEPVQRTPIHTWHVEQGAQMTLVGSWLRPEQYGEPALEVEAVRQRVGLIDVSTLGKLQLTGVGVPALLERIYVNRWQSLTPGRVRYGVICNDEGIVLDDGVCANLGAEGWYLSTTSSGAASIYEWLQWWLQSGWGAGVHLTHVTDLYAAFNLAGPRARELLQTLTDLDLSNPAFPYMQVRSGSVAGVPCRLLRIGFTGELSYEIHTPTGYGLHLWQALMAAGAAYGIAPVGVEAQRILRLEKGHLIVGQDTDGLTDPISAGLGGLVRLEKPDFLGKRALSRIARHGPRQRLVGFTLAPDQPLPEEGLQIVQPAADGRLEIIGWVTSSRRSPTLGHPIGLCWLPVELAGQEGAHFTIRRQQGLLEAVVHHGPFYDPAEERLRQ